MRWLQKNLTFGACFVVVFALVAWFMWWLASAASEGTLTKRRAFEVECAQRGGYISETYVGSLTCFRPPHIQRTDQPKE